MGIREVIGDIWGNKKVLGLYGGIRGCKEL